MQRPLRATFDGGGEEKMVGEAEVVLCQSNCLDAQSHEISAQHQVVLHRQDRKSEQVSYCHATTQTVVDCLWFLEKFRSCRSQ